jgi:uncharacterized protein involved in exopolysaccharide biosynthesis
MTESYIDDEINLRDYWRVLVRRRFLIFGMTCLAAVATAIFTLLQPNIYQSKATLMPLGKSGGGLGAALGELGSLLPLKLGGAATESPVERIVAVLHSRTLAEDVIQQLGLLPRLFVKMWDREKQQWRIPESPTMQDAIRVLAGLVTITSDRKTGVITIAVEHTDPSLAATIANQYIDALQRVLNANAFSLAKKNRFFVEAQLKKTRQDLTAAEEALRQFEQRYKIIALDVQAEEAVKIIAMLQGEIMAKEVQLGVLQRTVTGASREVALLQEELQGLSDQLARLQYGSSTSRHAREGTARSNQAFPVFDEAPEIKLQYARLQRDVLIQNKLFTLLTQQLEHAKIEEAKDETAFQVLDEAIPPEKRVRPKRRQSVTLAVVVGALIGIVVAFIRESLDSTIHTREQVEKQLGLPLLATIPSPVPHSRHQRQEIITALEASLLQQSPGTSLVGACRFLYTRLKQYKNEHGIQMVMCMSVGLDVASSLLANVAIVAAKAGERTLLMDGNLRQPTLHRLFQCPLVPGLRDALMQPEAWQKSIQTTAIDKLDLIPAGPVNSATLTPLGLPTLDSLLAHCKEAYNLILCVAPPASDLSDAIMLASKADACCLVLTYDVSCLDAVSEARTMLEAVHAHIIGAILVSASSGSS